MDNCGHGNAVACVIPFYDSNKMWLTDNFTKFTHPQIARLMVVFHEARHAESSHGNWAHADCPEPFLDASGVEMKSLWTGALLAGEPACDETPFGSYGSSTIMLKNIEKRCSNCTDKVKLDAGIYADDQLGRIIDSNAKAKMLSDFKKLEILDNVLALGHDNDSRLDKDFNNLTASQKRLFESRYARIPAEARNQLGTLVYLLGKQASSKADWSFLSRVLQEPMPKNLKVDEVTAAYPALMALKLAARAKSEGHFVREAEEILKTGLRSPVVAIKRLAKQLTGKN